MQYKLVIYFEIDDKESENTKLPMICTNSKRTIYQSGADHVFSPKVLDIFDKQIFPKYEEETTSDEGSGKNE